MSNPVFDNAQATVNTTNQIAGGTTTLSGYAMGSGANGVIFAIIGTWNNGGTATGCSGVTAGGQAMTKIPGSFGGSGDHYSEAWVLIAPPTGSISIVATVSGKTDKLGLAVASWTQADQTNGYDVVGQAVGTVATVTKAITLNAGNEYLFDGGIHVSANTASSNTDTSILNNGTSGMCTFGQYGSRVSSGSQSMSWTFPDPGDGWAYTVLAVKAASGVAAPTPQLALTGVGS